MLQVSIDTKLKVDVGGVHRSIKIKNQSAIKEIVDRAIEIVKRESPVGETGAFQESIRRLDSTGSDNPDGSSERFIRIGPIIYYRRFVIEGINPGPGRYVPVLDVRIRSGVHPGTDPNPIMVRAKRRLRPIINQIIQKHYGSFKLGDFI